ncbi:MAG TPA: SAM-dependent methyltransferase [Actinophytocola sp.]|uniref:SAM-dependent methyltransferase n=1 Tax=Actinophytocola sp. TaxID=1872138 RepID=UPI002DDCE71C|nr:SAM-dependent methyltransferase [Actinophytocola sp.]HEV2779242.1 SAM-dependent methyltransferase [Actinophytocola sp.]
MDASSLRAQEETGSGQILVAWHTRSSQARIHDHLLGGSLNNALDRTRAQHVLKADPLAAERARAHRTFLAFAVRHMLAHGIRQFLDLGSGLPTCEPTHRVAGRLVRDVRVVYVDNDPGTVAASQLLLTDVPGVIAVNADVRDPDAVFQHPGVSALVDLDQPLGVLVVDLLHAMSDLDHPATVLTPYVAVLSPNSRLALTVRAGADPRHRETLRGWLGGLHPVGHGIAPLGRWVGSVLAAGVESDLATIAVRVPGKREARGEAPVSG